MEHANFWRFLKCLILKVLRNSQHPATKSGDENTHWNLKKITQNAGNPFEYIILTDRCIYQRSLLRDSIVSGRRTQLIGSRIDVCGKELSSGRIQPVRLSRRDGSCKLCWAHHSAFLPLGPDTIEERRVILSFRSANDVPNKPIISWVSGFERFQMSLMRRVGPSGSR